VTITHIFFDVHTLIDSARLWAVYPVQIGQVMAEKYGGVAASWVDAYRRIAADWDSYFADLDFDGDDGADLWEGELRITRALFRLIGISQPDMPALTTLSRELPYLATRGLDVFYPDCKAVLEKLHQAGFILSVAGHVVSAKARGMLEGAGVEKLFTEPFLCADVTGYFRKDIAFYRAVSVPTENCLLVDERLDGIAGAKAAGMHTVQLCRVYAPSPDSPADYILKGDLSGLLDYLGK
jgi:phosphoglycolate phosphatase-like HAD superfamily hydrolase